MIKEVNYKDSDFFALCEKLEQTHVDVVAEQRVSWGNCLVGLEKFEHVLLYYIDEKAVGSLAISKPEHNVVEIGKVYVLPEHRNEKIATKLFERAFAIIQDQGNEAIVLDTYGRLESAVHLYKKLGFEIVDRFEELKDSPYSICMRKEMK